MSNLSVSCRVCSTISPHGGERHFSISFWAQGMCLHEISCITWRAAVEILHLVSPDRSCESVIIFSNLTAWSPVLSKYKVWKRAYVLGQHPLNIPILKVSWVSDYGRMELKRIIVFSIFFRSSSTRLWLGAASRCAQSNQWWISWQKHRENEKWWEREGRWNQILKRQISLKLLSSPTSKLYQHMPNRHQLQNSNLKERECVLVCLRIHNVCFCLTMCFQNSLSVSLYLHVPTFRNTAAPSKWLVISSDLPSSSSLFSFHLLPSSREVAPLLPPFLYSVSFSFPPLSSSSLAFFLLHPHPRSSFLLPLAVTFFPLLMGQSSTLLVLLPLLVSCILELSRHRAKTFLSPPHLPTMSSPFFFFTLNFLFNGLPYSFLSLEFSHFSDFQWLLHQPLCSDCLT